MSRGFLRLPWLSIRIFSSRCGSGTKGASPSNTQRTNRMPMGILSINCMVSIVAYSCGKRDKDSFWVTCVAVSSMDLPSEEIIGIS